MLKCIKSTFENEVIMRKKILQCLEEIGCIVDEETEDLSEIIVDSVMYISFIVEIEELFCIEIPDEYLAQDNLMSVSDICVLVDDLIANINV